MKIRQLVQQWEQNATGQLTSAPYQVHLDVEAAARLAALHHMYPKRRPEELLAELLSAALEDLEASMPYVQGSQVVAADEEGNPVYEDIGPTPRFLELARHYRQELDAGQPPSPT